MRCRQFQVARAGPCSMTPPPVLENGGVFRETANVCLWGWSRRTGGQAQQGGGRQQAARKIGVKTSGMLHGFFTPDS